METPLVLRTAMLVGGLFGVVGTLVGVWAVLRLGLSEGPFLFDGREVPRGQFLGVALPFLALYIVACLTAGSAAVALRRRDPRSRMLLLGLLGEFVIGDAAMLTWMRYSMGVGAGEMAASAFFFAVLVAVGLWYLFRKESVVSYYRSLRAA